MQAVVCRLCNWHTPDEIRGLPITMAAFQLVLYSHYVYLQYGFVVLCSVQMTHCTLYVARFVFTLRCDELNIQR